VLFFGTWVVGLFLIIIGKTVLFPLVGGLAAFGSYLLYAYFLFNDISRVGAFACFIAGVLAVLFTFGITSVAAELDNENPWLYFNWQMLVGTGHIFAVYAKMKTMTNPGSTVSA
jgi:hypothetical protein